MIVSFITQEGGVGKSSLTYNLACYMAHKKENPKRVLIVDMDGQSSNLTMIAGVDKKDIFTVSDILTETCTVMEAVKEISENLFIVPANDFVSDLPATIKCEKIPFDRLRKKLSEVKDSFDYIFIDSGPSPSSAHEIALIASDYMIVPMTTDYKSIEAATSMIFIYNNIREKKNPDLKNIKLVFNTYDERAVISRSVITVLSKTCNACGVDIAKTKIPRSKKFSEASAFGRGITDHAEKSKQAKTVIDLANELFGE